MPQQVEFTHFSLHTYPPMPFEVTEVTPLTETPLPAEQLSDDLLIVFNNKRRLGRLASNNWLDIDQFRMASGKPPAEIVYPHIPGREYAQYLRLRSRYHMRAATMLFKSMCLSPEVTPEVDKARITVNNVDYSVRSYIQEASQYHHAGSYLALDYLLLSRNAIVRLAQGDWYSQAFKRSRIGDAQLTVLDRLVDQPSSPYIDPNYDFDFKFTP